MAFTWKGKLFNNPIEAIGYLSEEFDELKRSALHFVPKGTYNDDTQYDKNDLVDYELSNGIVGSFLCIVPSIGYPPDINPERWQIIAIGTRGEKGDTGERGETGSIGPIGPPGPSGNAFFIRGRVATVDALPNPGQEGWAYQVGPEGTSGNPIYIWDVDTFMWDNIGSIEGPSGTAIFTTTSVLTNESGGITISRASISVPLGQTIKIGDLLISTNQNPEYIGVIRRVTNFVGTQDNPVTAFVTQIRGTQGINGEKGAGWLSTSYEITGGANVIPRSEINETHEVRAGDFILSYNNGAYGEVTDVDINNAYLTYLGSALGPQGGKGVSYYYSPLTFTDISTIPAPIVNIVPNGIRTGDFLMNANGLLFQATDVNTNSVYGQYLTSLKGAKGDKSITYMITCSAYVIDGLPRGFISFTIFDSYGGTQVLDWLSSNGFTMPHRALPAAGAIFAGEGLVYTVHSVYASTPTALFVNCMDVDGDQVSIDFSSASISKYAVSTE